jgi:hypothetical protein
MNELHKRCPACKGEPIDIQPEPSLHCRTFKYKCGCEIIQVIERPNLWNYEKRCKQ